VNPLTVKVSAIASAATAIAIVAWSLYSPKRYDQALERIQNGDSLHTVQGFMGREGREEKCGAMVNAPTHCAKELVFSDPGAPLLPRYWIVWLDANQRVVGKFHAISV
jgi:hypothetical protein